MAALKVSCQKKQRPFFFRESWIPNLSIPHHLHPPSPLLMPCILDFQKSRHLVTQVIAHGKSNSIGHQPTRQVRVIKTCSIF